MTESIQLFRLECQLIQRPRPGSLPSSYDGFYISPSFAIADSSLQHHQSCQFYPPLRQQYKEYPTLHWSHSLVNRLLVNEL